MTKKNNTFDFEQSLTSLETLVKKMESGEMSLEQSLKSFEQGVRLTRDCQKALAEAEQKVQILLEKDGSISSQPFVAPDREES